MTWPISYAKFCWNIALICIMKEYHITLTISFCKVFDGLNFLGHMPCMETTFECFTTKSAMRKMKSNHNMHLWALHQGRLRFDKWEPRDRFLMKKYKCIMCDYCKTWTYCNQHVKCSNCTKLEGSTQKRLKWWKWVIGSFELILKSNLSVIAHTVDGHMDIAADRQMDRPTAPY